MELKRIKAKLSGNANDFKKPALLVVLLICMAYASYAQKVTGTVSDQEGMPIPGVTILEKGTANGSVTDGNGNYQLTPKSQEGILVFSFVGFENEEIPINNQSVIDVVMEVSTIDIDEVVAIGYGSVKRSNLTSAVSKVGGDKLENRVVANLSQALSGQLSGVRVQQSSGVPGASPEIYVRGVGSLNGSNEPLFVIDGFPVEDPVIINSIDFSNVESVQVLKDASSTSIYGARGANGIILIKTRSGEKGRSNITFKANKGYQNILKRVDYLSGPEFAEHRWWARQNSWVSGGNDPNATNDQRPGGSYDLDPNWLIPDSIPHYDVQDWLFETGSIQNYNLTATGGNNKGNYMITGGYFEQSGIVRNSGYERFSMRANMKLNINEHITIGANLSPSYVNSKNVNHEGKSGAISPLLITQIPMYPIEESVANEFGSSSNKFADMLIYSKDGRRQAAFSGSTYLQLDVVQGLTFKTQVGFSFSNEQRDQFDPIEVTKTNPPLGLARLTNRRKWQIENTLTYNKVFEEKHEVTLLLGQSAQEYNYYDAQLRGLDFPNSLSYTLNNANSFDVGQTYTREVENTIASYFGRVNYVYDSRYMFSASLRRDGSSRFGSDSKWGLFPSTSAGWNIANEPFMENIKATINRLKLRASWGKTGNNGIPDYREFPLLQGSNYVFGTNESLVLGMSNANIANPNLKWEKSAMTNIGIDLGLYKNRIQFSTEYFINKTEDLLMNIPLSTTTGFSSALVNYGSVENKGWEFDLTTNNVNSDLKWTTNFNISFLKNEVTQLGPDNAPIEGGAWYAPVHLTEVGGPVGAFYMYEAIGVFMDQADLDSYPSYGNSRPGDLKIKDQLTEDTDGDGVPDMADGKIDSRDRTVLGQGAPKYFWGLTNTFTYKDFELSVLLTGAGGNKIYNAVSRQSNTGADGQMFGLWRNAWKSPQDPGDGVTPRASRNNSGANRLYNSRYLYDGDYWKIANITLSYNLPKELIGRVGLSNAKCFVTGDNLYLKDKYPIGHNPEVNEARGNPFRAGDDYNTYPLARTITFGIEVGF